MQIETILERINNAEKKITKVKGTLVRHNKKKDKIKNKLAKSNVDVKKYDKFEDRIRESDLYWDLCDYEHCLEDIENNEKKLKEFQNDLEKYNNLLEVEKQRKKDIENLLPDCVKEYLESWKLKMKDYIVSVAEEYIALYHKEYEVTREELEELKTEKCIKNESTGRRELIYVRKYSDEKITEILQGQKPYDIEKAQLEINYRYLKRFLNRQNLTMIDDINRIVEYKKEINLETLDEILTKDIEVKKEMFVQRVSAVVGVVKDMKGFNIGDNGEINGMAIGDKARAYVTTIIAGGYNIQCEHFRVLVNKIK